MDKIRVETAHDRVHLSPHQGDFLKALIRIHAKTSQAEFSHLIGMNKTLLSRYLTGDLRITVPALDTILSGITFVRDNIQYRYKATWKTLIEIHPVEIGPAVPTVDSMQPEETSLSEDSG